MNINRLIFITLVMLLINSCSSGNSSSSVQKTPTARLYSPSTTATITLSATTTMTPKPAIIAPSGTPSETPTVKPSFTPTVLINTRTPVIPASYLPIPTTDYSGLGDIWVIYVSNSVYQFSFEYPKLYQNTQYKNCKISELHADPWLLYLRFGYRSELAVTKNDLPSVDDYVDRWINGDSIEYRDYEIINNLQAITIDYRFGGLNRFGTSTFISLDRLIYIFNFTAGGMCDIDEIGLDEFTIYKHAVETFKITTPNP